MSIQAVNRLNSELNSIDKSIGYQLRAKRMSKGLSQEELAEKLHIHPEDISAYEKGKKRISALRLLHMAEALSVRPTYFFGLSDERGTSAAEDEGQLRNGAGVYLTLPDQGMRLNRAFIGVKNAALREAVITLVVELARNQETANEQQDANLFYSEHRPKKQRIGEQ